MRNLYIAIIVVLISFGVMNQAHALRCGTKLINKGDSILKVLEYCGQPVYSDYVVYRQRLTRLYIYKQGGREQRIYLRAGRVIGVE